MKVSVVIPTLNRGALFHDTLRQVLAQRMVELDVWIVDQSDPEQRLANEAVIAGLADGRVHYVHLPVKGLPNARNEGLARARGDIILFLDDDVILLSELFVLHHVNGYADPHVGGVTGRIIERYVRPNLDNTGSYISPGGRTMTNQWGTVACDIATLKGANMSYRAEACRMIGGFDRNYSGTALLEDSDYSTRIRAAGWRLRYEPACELVHLSSPSGGVRVEDAARAEFWRFRSTAYFMLKHRGISRFPLFVGTFGAIAVTRSLRWRSASASWSLGAAVRDGVAAWRRGPDDALPVVR